jgi:hypothetical protein
MKEVNFKYMKILSNNPYGHGLTLPKGHFIVNYVTKMKVLQ